MLSLRDAGDLSPALSKIENLFCFFMIKWSFVTRSSSSFKDDSLLNDYPSSSFYDLIGVLLLI